MPEAFDPYYRWLGIPPTEQPPNHYRLIGVELFESNRDVIDSVASRHIGYLQEITNGPNVREAQRLLNELAAARRCLLDPEKKAAYDADLKTTLAAESKPPKAASPPRRQRSERPSPTPPPPKMSQGRPANRSVGQKKPPVAGTTESMLHGPPSPATERKNKNPMPLIAGGIAAGAVVLLAIAGLLLFGGDGRDEARQAQQQTLRAASAKQAAKIPERPATVKTQNSPDDSVAKAALDTSPLPDVRVEEPVEPKDVPVGAKPADGPPAAAIATDGLPVQVDGLLLWLDASNGSSVATDDNGCINKWNDRSGKSCHATADGADRGPHLVQGELDGHSVVRFSGSQCLEIEGKSELFKLGAEYTFVFVARGQQGTLLSKGNGDSAGSFAMCEGVASLRSKGTDLNAKDDDGTVFRVRTIFADETSLRWYIDGQPNAAFPSTEHAIRSTSRVRIGAIQKRGKGLQGFFEGELAELLVYDRPLADDERREVEAYLQEKWLPDGTPPLSVAKTETPSPKEAGVDDGQPDSAVIEPAQETEDVKPAGDGEVVNKAVDRRPGERFTLFVNLGGDAWEDPEGNAWRESKRFDGTTFGHEGGRSVKHDDEENPVAKTAQRGITAFRAVVPNGIYEVRLYFSEHWTAEPKRRVFAVFAEQQPVRRPPNVFLAPGLGTPYIHTVPKVTVSDGRLDIDFRPANEDASAILNGISIRQLR